MLIPDFSQYDILKGVKTMGSPNYIFETKKYIRSSLRNSITLPNGIVMPIFTDEMKSKEIRKPNFIDKTFSISGLECDDFSMPSRKYKVIGDISNVDGIDINSFIVKQIEGDTSHSMFTLTKNDCKHLGINYQSGLQLLPKSQSIKFDEDISLKFDRMNLSTYPLSFDDKKSIMYMVIEIPCVNNGTQIICENTLYNINSFEIRTRKNIFSQNGFSSFNFNDSIPFRVLKKRHTDNILLELSFGKHINGVLCGLEPNTINGSFDDFFKVIVHTQCYLDNQIDNKLYNKKMYFDFD